MHIYSNIFCFFFDIYTLYVFLDSILKSLMITAAWAHSPTVLQVSSNHQTHNSPGFCQGICWTFMKTYMAIILGVALGKLWQLKKTSRKTRIGLRGARFPGLPCQKSHRPSPNLQQSGRVVKQPGQHTSAVLRLSKVGIRTYGTNMIFQIPFVFWCLVSWLFKCLPPCKYCKSTLFDQK